MAFTLTDRKALGGFRIENIGLRFLYDTLYLVENRVHGARMEAAKLFYSILIIQVIRKGRNGLILEGRVLH